MSCKYALEKIFHLQKKQILNFNKTKKKTPNKFFFANIEFLQTNKNSLSEIEKRERRAMERKLSELEEELKVNTF